MRFLNWLATLGIELDVGVVKDEPSVLLQGMRDGTKLLRILDDVVPNSVNWSKVEMQTKTNAFKMLANIELLLETMRNLGIQCQLITANQILQMNLKSLLSLLWIMMREYFRRKLNILSEEEFNTEADKFIPPPNITAEADCVMGIAPEESPEFEPLRPVLFYGSDGEVFTSYHDEASQIECDPLPEDFTYLTRMPLKCRGSVAEIVQESILHLKTRWKCLPLKKSRKAVQIHERGQKDNQSPTDTEKQLFDRLLRQIRSPPSTPPSTMVTTANQDCIFPQSTQQTSLAAVADISILHPHHPNHLPSPLPHQNLVHPPRVVSQKDKPHRKQTIEQQVGRHSPKAVEHSVVFPADIQGSSGGKVCSTRSRGHEHESGLVNIRRGYFSGVSADKVTGGSQRKQMYTSNKVEPSTNKVPEVFSYKSAVAPPSGFDNLLSVPTSRFGCGESPLKEVKNHQVFVVGNRPKSSQREWGFENINIEEKENHGSNFGITQTSHFRSRSQVKQSPKPTTVSQKYASPSNYDILVGIGANGPTLLEIILKTAVTKDTDASERRLKQELLKKHHFTRFKIGKDTKPTVPFFLKLCQDLNKEGLLQTIKSNRYFVHSRIVVNTQNYASSQQAAAEKSQLLQNTLNGNQSTFNFNFDAVSKSQFTCADQPVTGYLSLFNARIALEKIIHGLPQDSQSRKTISDLLQSLENLITPARSTKTGACTPLGTSHSSYLYPPQPDALPQVFTTLKQNRLLSCSQRLLIRRAEVIISRARTQITNDTGSWTPVAHHQHVPPSRPTELIITPLDISPN